MLFRSVCDRDAIIAVHGVQKRELLDKRCSQELEQLMELRRSYRYQDGDLPVRPTDASDRYRVGAAAPIVTEGDLMGCVLLLSEDGAPALGEAEQRLVQTVAGFLGRQMESLKIRQGSGSLPDFYAAEKIVAKRRKICYTMI